MVYFIVHYSEIGIKKGNRAFFENLLTGSIRKRLKKGVVARKYGYILVESEDKEKTVKELEKVPGIAYFILCEKAKLDAEDVEKKAVKLLKKKDFKTFRVSARRQNKNFQLTSVQLNERVGARIVEELEKKVKLTEPDVNLIIEVVEKNVFLSTERFEGVGGLPTDPQKKVVCLLSGGFDSPVASYLMIKRGAKAVLVHFQNYKLMKGSIQDKVEKLGRILSGFQGKTRLYVVPFEKVQEDIIRKGPANVRMLAYRRVMLKISEEIMRKEKAKALVTGDNLSQVSSQTLENLRAVYDATKELVLSPLIGFNKEEIINLSKKIGAFDVSKLPYGDCCSFFLPEHPELRSSAEDLRKIEETLDKDLWVSALKSSKVYSL